MAAVVPGPDDRDGPGSGRRGAALPRAATGALGAVAELILGSPEAVVRAAVRSRPAPWRASCRRPSAPRSDPGDSAEPVNRPVARGPAARSRDANRADLPAVQRRPAGAAPRRDRGLRGRRHRALPGVRDRHDAPAVRARGDPRRADQHLGAAARWPGWAGLVLALATYVGVLVIVGLITAIGIFRLLDELPTDTTELQTQHRDQSRRPAGRGDHRRRVRLRGGLDRPVGAERAGGGRLQRDHRRLPAPRAADDRRPDPLGVRRSARRHEPGSRPRHPAPVVPDRPGGSRRDRGDPRHDRARRPGRPVGAPVGRAELPDELRPERRLHHLDDPADPARARRGRPADGDPGGRRLQP